MTEIFCNVLTFIFMVFIVNEACNFLFDIDLIAYLKSYVQAYMIAKKGKNEDEDKK